jgi:3-isopropylmalate dehydrogenase
MYKIAVLPGDGIGVEIVPEAIKALQAVGEKYDHQFQFTDALVGGAAYDVLVIPCLQKPCRFANNLMRSC